MKGKQMHETDNINNMHSGLSKDTIHGILKKEKATSDKIQTLKQAEMLTLLSFLTTNYAIDAPVILKDFLSRVEGNPERFCGDAYIPNEPGMYGYGANIAPLVLNMLWKGVKQGDETAKSIFITLYKCYFKREYNQLKKFKRLDRWDILDLSCEDDKQNMLTTARILTISPYMEIEVDAGSDYSIYKMQDAIKGWRENCYLPNRLGNISTQEQADLIETFYDNYTGSTQVLYKKFISVWNILLCFAEVFGLSHAYIGSCHRQSDEFALTAAKTFYMLNELELGDEFDEDILANEELFALFMAIQYLIEAIADKSEIEIDYTRNLIGDHRSIFESYIPMYKPPNTNVHRQSKQTAPIKAPDKLEKKITQDAKGDAEGNAEIEELRRQIKRLEAENAKARRQLSEAEESLSGANETIKKDTKELSALRSFLYMQSKQGSEKNPNKSNINRSHAIDYLSGKRIAIIGGHPNWYKKIKEVFPDWKYIGPSAANAKLSDELDYVFFYTEILGHKTYWKYISECDRYAIPFGYVKGTNLDVCIGGMYKTISNDNKNKTRKERKKRT